ncbi:odorant receptor Or1-like [Tenebrio molitor]|uniref:odorant receptor Or1-like n=1 Tax=Tenebrio molitor TaxID=7067 RepID=UPI0036249137
MERYDWKRVLRTNILKLKVVGLWPPDDELYKPNAYTLWAICSITILNVGHNFFQMVNMIFVFDDLHDLVQATYITLPQVVALMKTYYVVRNMKILKELMVTLSSDMFQPKNDRQVKMIKPSFSFWRVNYVMYWTMSSGAMFFWSVYPILDKSIKEYPLPFLAWYPWNTKASPMYELTYLHQIVALLFIASTAMSVDTLIAALNIYIGAQFDILCDDIKHLFDPDSALISFNQKLISIIKHHKEIVKFAANTNKFANWIILAQFFTSAGTIGITLFQMTAVAPLSSEFFSCIAFTFSMTLEIFIYCWFGNEVEIKSRNVVYTVFKSNWTDASMEVKKNMIFFVMRCQRPVKMSALNLFYLSLDTFMRILRAAWSYFALLNQVSSR